METQTVTPTTNIYTQLLAAQCEYPTIEKDSVNPHLKNRYASLPSILNTVLPVLRKHGVLLTSSIKDDMSDILEVALVHAQTGTKVQSNTKLLNTSDMQKWGGSITYATRYSLLSLLGISADLDDDGNLASSNNQVTSAFAKPAPVNVTPQHKAISQPKPSEDDLNKIGLITFELHELWKKKEGSIRADGSAKALAAIKRFENELEGLTLDSLVKLKEWIEDGNFVDVIIPQRLPTNETNIIH
jgi:hypothetical protein